MTPRERELQRLIDFYIARAYMYVFLNSVLVEESLLVAAGLIEQLHKVFPREDDIES